MGKFLIGLVTGVLLVFLSVIILIAAALRMRERPPDIAADSVLVLRLSGDIPEKAPMALPDFLSNEPALTVSNVWLNLRKAAGDAKIRAVVLQPEGVSAGWGTLEEVRSNLEAFRKSGKPVFAYLRNPGARDYYLALAADRIYQGPSDPLILKGLRAEMMFFKNTLDKVGVSIEIEHAGKYKDAGDMFTRTDMSPETREVMNSVLDALYGNVVAKIAAARKKSPQDVMAIIDRGPFTATQAKQEGLVDELRFEDQMWGELKTHLKSGEPRKVPFGRYMKVPADTSGSRNRIALVVGEGDIVRGSPSSDAGEDTMLTSYGFNKMLKEIERDNSIKGVVVRIDSPGGEVTASDEMWRQMNLLSKKKPLVISMSDLAASGGYYMAMTGDPIVAYPGTLTGSIGVVFGKPTLRGLYDKIGVSKDAIDRGRHAGIDSDYKPLTPEEREILKRGIDDTYRDFIAKVAAGRKRSPNEIEQIAQGRVWLGSQAKANGLVDELGGLDTALDLVKKKAGLPAGEQVRVSVYPPRRTLIETLLKRSQEDALETSVARVFGRVPYHAWMQGGMLRMMPYWIEIK